MKTGFVLIDWVFLDYVDKSTVDSYTFKEFGTDKEIRLFDKYDIWNIEANDPNDIGQEMPSEMSENVCDRNRMSKHIYENKTSYLC